MTADLPISERVSAPTARDDVLIGMLREVVPAIMRANGTPGISIALARHGVSVWEAGFGFADIAQGVAMTPDHTFRCGSLGKLFTATAIMQLEEKGLLSLEDDVSEHVPLRIVNPIGGGKVTIGQLLSHRSGLAAWDAAGASVAPTPGLLQYVKSAFSKSVSPQYGGTHTALWDATVEGAPRYSSLGFALLGLAVESRDPAGRHLADYVLDEILDPIGATRSSYSGQSRAVAPSAVRRSVGYTDLGCVRMVSPEIEYACYPGQGYVGTPGDVLKLALAMLRGGAVGARRILSPGAVKRMLTPQGTQRFAVIGTHPGLGWMLQHAGEPKASFLHAGSHAYGWRSVCVAWPHAQTALAVSCNQISMPKPNADLHQIIDFVGSWLPHGQTEHEPCNDSDWPWKLSYVRGLLFVESTQGWLGLDEAMEHGELVQAQTPPAGWSRAGFEQGVADLRSEPITAEGIRAFVSSSRIKVTPDEIERAIYEFGTAPDRTLYPSLIVQAALRALVQ